MLKKEVLFAYFPKNTYRRYQDLLAAFFTLERAWEAGFNDLKKLKWEDNLIHEFLLWKDEINEEQIQSILNRENIKVLTQDDPDYPVLLKQVYDPPVCIFYRGSLQYINRPIAFVGSRHHSNYGRTVAEKLIKELADYDITVVSGLAIGIDSIVHQATLSNYLNTIAVLGSGIDRQHIYPAVNKYLAEQIIDKSGAILSEYPPGTLPSKFTFPKRNRIIAGISLGTVVIEAAHKSGTLSTAQYALDSGRDVFAVPQQIDTDLGQGVNNLIKSGAHLITSGNEIMEILNLQKTPLSVKNNRQASDS